MKHIIISDTHAPQCIYKALNHAQDLIEEQEDIEAIVINGDLLGIFSMTGSNLYKGEWIQKEIMDEFLKKAAPKFYEEFKKTGVVTKKLAYEYIGERYAWTYKILRASTKIKKTIFNLGNHESKLHFLVVNELSFLTGCDRNILNSLDNKILEKIYDLFEKNLKLLENENDFIYIRNKHHIHNKTLILGIPGESHDTEDLNPTSIKQEQKTKLILENASKDLDKCNEIIIYNHTQGAYDRETGTFQPASSYLKGFLKEIKKNKPIIFIQSHNHWSYTQCMYQENIHYIMNNAGLHDGVFNLVETNEEEVICYDVDPNTKKTIKLKFSDKKESYNSEEELISRYYEDPKIIFDRKSKVKNE
ncbi:MAG: metallophosphoesterase [Candidatus Cloacimonetes bacterium]|nr:metallophosphoesterase [Candidatus Cloacimonadota bacterium]MCF8012758.1 metallophosphoesterase [Candidatus Woesearchaeota archaeon]